MKACRARWRTPPALVLFGALAFLVAGTDSEARGSSRFSHGNWDGVAMKDLDGRFGHCEASAIYRRGHILTVVVSRHYGWGIAITHEDWDYAVDREIELRVRIDRGAWRRFAGKAVDEQTVLIPLTDDDSLVTPFRRGRYMDVSDGKVTLSFALTGTNVLFARLVECVATELDLEEETAEFARKDETEEGATAARAGGGGPKTASGTGFVISTRGQIVTNHHVVEECRTLRVNLPGDVAHEARLVVSDQRNDLALIRTDLALAEGEVAELRLGRPIPAGERIAVFGFPLAGALSSSGNLVEGNVTAVAGLGDDISQFQISAPVQPGNSGGPLLDFGGAVIGVVNARINDLAVAAVTGSLPQNVNFAIKANVLSNFLDAHSVAYRTSEAEKTMDLATVGTRARQFTVMVHCEY